MEVGGGAGGPVGVFRGAGELRDEDQCCFEGAGGDSLEEGWEIVDERLKFIGVLSRISKHADQLYPCKTRGDNLPWQHRT